MPVGETQIFRFGPFELDTHCGQLRKDGVGLKLQGQPVQILEILLEKPRQLVTREELRERLWASDTFVDFDHSLNTAIKKLRQAMGDEADMPRYIETLPRRGYRFIGEVERESAQEEDGEAGAALPISRVAQETQIDDRPRVRWKLAVVISAVVVLAIAAAGGVYEIIKPPPSPRIVGSHALTHTGYRKAWDERAGFDHRLLTDGQRVFFREERPSGSMIMEVPRTGGEVSEMRTSPAGQGSLRDISQDGTEILDSVFDPETFTLDAWAHPVTGGPGRLIVKDAKSPRWTPDRRTILFARNNEKNPHHDRNLFESRELYRANSDGTEERRLAELPDVNLLTISPDGRRIRFMATPGSVLWEANSDGSNPHRLFPSRQGMTLPGDWSSDGKYFFFTTSWSGERQDLWALRETQYPWPRVSQPVQLTYGPMSILSPTVSQDGKQVYAVALERHGELAVYDRKSAKFIPYMSGLPVCYVDFSKDGQWIAYVSYPDGSLWRSRVDGSERRQLTVPPMAVISPRWSPDGKLIAFTDFANGDRRQMAPYSTRRVFAISADGGAPMFLAGGISMDPTWSPDGRAIAYATRLPNGKHEIRILDLASMDSKIVPDSQNMFSPRWSPDGKYLAAMDIGHSRLAIYSFASQAWTDVLKVLGLNWPSWSRDGKSIYLEGSVRGIGDSLIRVGIEDYKSAVIASLNDVRSTSFFYWNFGWFGLTPDDRPITTLDTGIEEIYSFDLEYK